MLTINIALLLAVIVFFRLRRRTQARSRVEERTTVLIVLALGVVIAPTQAGQWLFDAIGQLAEGIAQITF
ncbi:hypothetical protein [Streptomyces inusitatus]|uniref:hypothetical protein n=1 Tax=Streptomyces inusitatus TaxID=68221 RepID=UPI00167CB020|nr:hypothetical protein [Streptomyces inusitatus]